MTCPRPITWHKGMNKLANLWVGWLHNLYEKRCDTKVRLELVKVLVPTYKQKLPPTAATSRPSTLQKELHYKMTTSREDGWP